MLNGMDFRAKAKELKAKGELDEFIAEEVYKISLRCPTCQERLGKLEGRMVWVTAVAVGGGAAAGTGVPQLIRLIFGG